MTNATTVPATAFHRSLAFWLAAVIGAFQAVNAVRAFADPSGFAAFYGTPIIDPRDIAFIYVYALRTSFIAILVAFFLIRQQVEALKWMALAALVMPIGDALLVTLAHGSPLTIARHVATAIYLGVTFLVFRRYLARTTAS
ncbi:MAG: DUF4267 domain-containing protein [Alphaproteobacteria bacterium]